MLLSLYNNTELQGNPSWLTNILPGGSGTTQIAGTTAVPFIAFPTEETVNRTVLDFTYYNANPAYTTTPQAPGQTTMPAINGQLVVVQALTGNSGAANWQLSQIAQQKLPQYGYGIVNGPALNDDTISNPGCEASVVVQGPINAFCVTGSTVAIAPGTPLVADGSGNLTPAPVLASGTAPTNGTGVVVTPAGATGAAHFSYEIAAIGADGSTTAVSAAGSTTTANATLSPINYNGLTWTAGTNVITYVVIRSAAPAGYATGIIGYTGGLSFADIGQPSKGAYGGANTTPPDATYSSAWLATSLGTLAVSTSTPTLVPVLVGKY